MTARQFPAWPSPRIFPAIDVRGGRCVRLVRGARDAEIDYGADPVEVAARWVSMGAECLHVVDLGAALGEAHSRDAILAIVRAVPVPVQAGGGLRDETTLARLLEGGVARAMLGTRAFQDAAFLNRVVARHGADRIVVSMDVSMELSRDGGGDRIKVSGWEATSSLGIDEGLRHVEAAGVTRLLVTATDRDGTLAGPRLDLLSRVLGASKCRVVAAGGIGSLADVASVLALGSAGLEGVVVGRALYEGKVDLKEAVELTRKEDRSMEGDARGGIEGVLDSIKYDGNGLVPAVVQDARDGQVLMVAYMNRESLRRTLTEGLTCFWSRSRKEFWVKGLTSGNTQKVVRVALDCDRDCVLVTVEQQGDGVACHTGNRSCFFTEVLRPGGELREIDTRKPIAGG